MTKLSRRRFLAAGASAAAAPPPGGHALRARARAASTLGANAFAQSAGGAGIKYPVEKDASLRVLRWKRFVQGDEDLWNVNVKKFTDLTGVAVRTDSEGWEDVRPKAAVAANVCSGPDSVVGWFDDPQQYPTKLVDVTDLATSLGGRFGGWYD